MPRWQEASCSSRRSGSDGRRQGSKHARIPHRELRTFGFPFEQIVRSHVGSELPTLHQRYSFERLKRGTDVWISTDAGPFSSGPRRADSRPSPTTTPATRSLIEPTTGLSAAIHVCVAPDPAKQRVVGAVGRIFGKVSRRAASARNWRQPSGRQRCGPSGGKHEAGDRDRLGVDGGVEADAVTDPQHGCPACGHRAATPAKWTMLLGDRGAAARSVASTWRHSRW